MWLVQNVPLPVAEEPEAMQNHGMKYAKSFVVFCEYNKLGVMVSDFLMKALIT